MHDFKDSDECLEYGDTCEDDVDCCSIPHMLCVSSFKYHKCMCSWGYYWDPQEGECILNDLSAEEVDDVMIIFATIGAAAVLLVSVFAIIIYCKRDKKGLGSTSARMEVNERPNQIERDFSPASAPPFQLQPNLLHGDHPKAKESYAYHREMASPSADEPPPPSYDVATSQATR